MSESSVPETAAADLVKLAVPTAYRQTDVEVNRRPYEAKNTAIRRQIARRSTSTDERKSTLSSFAPASAEQPSAALAPWQQSARQD
jgi:hypothetical protein